MMTGFALWNRHVQYIFTMPYVYIQPQRAKKRSSSTKGLLLNIISHRLNYLLLAQPWISRYRSKTLLIHDIHRRQRKANILRSYKQQGTFRSSASPSVSLTHTHTAEQTENSNAFLLSDGEKREGGPQERLTITVEVGDGLAGAARAPHVSLSHPTWPAWGRKPHNIRERGDEQIEWNQTKRKRIVQLREEKGISQWPGGNGLQEQSPSAVSCTTPDGRAHSPI